MPGAEPMSKEFGALLTCISRNEYEARSRQNGVNCHSGAISPPDVVPSKSVSELRRK